NELDHKCNNDCSNKSQLNVWWKRFADTVDDLILRSNVHNCGRNLSSGEKADKKDRPTCMTKHGTCKARFPRQIFEQTQVDPKTGALNMKKGEAWINTLTPCVTYLLRCNSDVTSLLSGTSIKAIVAYVTDYVTKPGLKTYSIFDSIKSVFTKNTEMLGGTMKQKEKARPLITQIINSLTSKMEIGSPMASLYLLNNPDHYTSHKFITVYWKGYVREAMNAFQCIKDQDEDITKEKVVLQKSQNGYVGLTSVYDYIYRPNKYNDICLYEWIQLARRVKIPKPTDKHDNVESDDELDMIEPNTDIQHHEENTVQDDFVVSDTSSDESDASDESDELNIQDNEHNVDSGNESNAYHSSSETGTESEASTNTENENIDNLFLSDHPLHETHWVEFHKSYKNVVPNFVGGSLPRRDRGDREYYCATMMTLFKPWRSGKCLKDDNESWDESFVNYKFTPRQNQIMEHFNIRYECN